MAGVSILARAEFLQRLRGLSLEVDLELPKGASPLVEEAGINNSRWAIPSALKRTEPQKKAGSFSSGNSNRIREGWNGS